MASQAGSGRLSTGFYLGSIAALALVFALLALATPVVADEHGSPEPPPCKPTCVDLDALLPIDGPEPPSCSPSCGDSGAPLVGFSTDGDAEAELVAVALFGEADGGVVSVSVMSQDPGPEPPSCSPGCLDLPVPLPGPEPQPCDPSCADAGGAAPVALGVDVTTGQAYLVVDTDPDREGSLVAVHVHAPVDGLVRLPAITG